LLTLLDEDEVGTCKDEKYDAEHENIAAGVRWHDIKGRSRRSRGANVNKTMFQLRVLSLNGVRCHQSEPSAARDGSIKQGWLLASIPYPLSAGLILLLCSIAFFISSDDVKTF